MKKLEINNQELILLSVGLISRKNINIQAMEAEKDDQAIKFLLTEENEKIEVLYNRILDLLAR